MVTEADGVAGHSSRLDRNEVEPDRQLWERGSIREPPLVAETRERGPEVSAFATVDRFLGEPEVATRSPPDLDDHQRWLTWIHRDDVKISTAHTNTKPEDRPSGVPEVLADELLRVVARSLGLRSHGFILAATASPSLNASCAAG